MTTSRRVRVRGCQGDDGSHGAIDRGIQRRANPLRLCVLSLLMVMGVAPPGADAGLLHPVLNLMRPRLERQLVSRCESLFAEDDAQLRELVAEPCRALARPASGCLIRETSRSGRELGVISELVGARIGDDAEVVIKACAAELLGLPGGSLNDLPLDQLLPRSRR